MANCRLQTRMGRRKLSRRGALGVIVLVALGALSLLNWVERGRFGVPEDGVVWEDRKAGVTASLVEPESPAARVGVRPGDTLLEISGQSMREALDATRALAVIGAWGRAEYVIEREGEVRRVSLVVGEDSSRGAVGRFLFVLGWAYAAIGLLVWLRCPRDGPTVRFYAFCTASFALYVFSATGQFDPFDRLVYWLDAWALLLVPPLFLDFCSRFPDDSVRSRTLTTASYGLAVAVGAAHHAAAGGWVGGGLEEAWLVRFFETAPLAMLAANLLASAVVIWKKVRRSEHPAYRLQLGWFMFGVVAGCVPFTAFYIVPFMAGIAPSPNQAFSVFSLAALPVSILVALFRFRLLDLELIWRKAIASWTAIAILLGSGYLALFRDGVAVRWLDVYGPVGWLCSLAIAAGLYIPMRNWILGTLERWAYRERFEERRTLAAFGTELAAETDAARMVSGVCDRLSRALNLDRVAVFRLDRESDSGKGRFLFLDGRGIDRGMLGGAFDFGPIESRLVAVDSTVVLTESVDDRSAGALAALCCRHFVPCHLRGRIIAWIVLGQTTDGGFLTTEDLSLVQALSAPFAIALENARLYSSLEAKAAQYQSLKDYNENIVESASVGIVVLDLDDRVQGWNTELELALHISRDQAVGRKLAELVPAALVSEIARCRGESGDGQIYKFRLSAAEFPEKFRPSDAESIGERTLNVSVRALVTKQLETTGRLVILDDVTERVNLEQRLVHADKLSATGLLAAGVAHEVNTPLAVISSYSQILAAKFTEGTDEARILGKVTEQTFRASEIVNSLLDFSRMSGVESTPCDLNRSILDTLDLIAPQLRNGGVTAVTDLGAETLVMANRGKLQQVFLNLFLNARDAMPGGGTLEISSRAVSEPEGDRVETLVSDTGVGMRPEVQERIFDPFYTTKGSAKGNGLGLAVTYGIIQELRGSISVASVPAKGTTFTVSLPCAHQSAHA